MDVHKGITSRTHFRRGTTRKKESYNSFIKMYMAQCHHPPLMGMYTMYHSLMIILGKDLDIFEVFIKIKEFKSLIREPFYKED
jgi:hypothetical protein